MDEKARKFFHKEFDELSDYERMMLDIMAEKEAAEGLAQEEEAVPEAPAADEIAAPAAEEFPAAEETEAAPPAEESAAPDDLLEALSADEPFPEAEAEPEPFVIGFGMEEESAELPDPQPSPDEADDSDVKIAGDKPSATAAERIPLLVEEKNPELEPVVVSRPTIQFMNSIEREKKITRKVRAQRRRSGIVVLTLCVALILVAFMYNGIVNRSWGVLEKPEPTPEVTLAPPEVHETPSPTPEPTPEPVREHSYLFERTDVSWVGAQDRCLAQGGYLAVINSIDEFNRITAQATAQGLECVWIGCHRDVASNSFIWENNETVDEAVDPNVRQMTLWADGEPSFIDGDGAAENYILLWNHDGRWSYWDSRNDIAGDFPGWRGRIAYVCELEN